MDGVKRPRGLDTAVDLRRHLPSAEPAPPVASAVPQTYTPPPAQASFDSVQRLQPAGSEIYADEQVGWLDQAWDFRYRLAAIAAAVLMLPPVALSLNHVASASRPTNLAQSAALPTHPGPVKPPTAAAATAPVSSEAAQLQKILSDFSGSAGAPYGLMVKDLKTGVTSEVNSGQQIESASLYKLFVAQMIYKMIDNGSISYSDSAGGGTGLTVDQCLNYMITISDNDCGRALGTQIGWGKQNAALANFGYKATNLATPQQTSAADVAIFFERLYNGTLLSPSSSNRLLTLLKNQRVNDRLPVGLPAGTVIAHKTGNLDGFVHDAGIVYGPKTDYVVVATSGPWDAPLAAPSHFADLSAKLWHFFNQ